MGVEPHIRLGSPCGNYGIADNGNTSPRKRRYLPSVIAVRRVVLMLQDYVFRNKYRQHMAFNTPYGNVKNILRG